MERKPWNSNDMFGDGVSVFGALAVHSAIGCTSIFACMKGCRTSSDGYEFGLSEATSDRSQSTFARGGQREKACDDGAQSKNKRRSL